MNYKEIKKVIRELRAERNALKEEMIGKGMKLKEICLLPEMIELQDTLAMAEVWRFKIAWQEEDEIFYELKEDMIDKWKMYNSEESRVFPELVYLEGLGFDLKSLRELILPTDERVVFPTKVESLLTFLGTKVLMGRDAEGYMGLYYSTTQSVVLCSSQPEEEILITLAHELGHHLLNIWGHSEEWGYGTGTWAGRIKEEWFASLLGIEILQLVDIHVTDQVADSMLGSFLSYLDSFENYIKACPKESQAELYSTLSHWKDKCSLE
jgi:hypothetical protein